MIRLVFWVGCVVVVLLLLLGLDALDADRGTLMAVIAGLLAAVLASNEDRVVASWQRRSARRADRPA